MGTSLQIHPWYFISLAPKFQFSRNNYFIRSSLTWRMQSGAQNLRLKSKDILDINSIHNVLLVPIDFPLLGIAEKLYIYTIFRVDPLHVFNSEIFRMLKNCMCEMLLSKDTFTDRCGKGDISMKMFSYISLQLTQPVLQMDSHRDRRSLVPIIGHLWTGTSIRTDYAICWRP